MQVVEIPVTKAQQNFSVALKHIADGKKVVFTKYGRKVADLVPHLKNKQKKRKLGTLKGKVKVKFAKDFKMTTEELLNL